MFSKGLFAPAILALLLALYTSCTAQATDAFIYPPPARYDDAGNMAMLSDYTQQKILLVDGSATIRWTTSYRAYNIRLYQKSLTDSTAKPAQNTLYDKSVIDRDDSNYGWYISRYRITGEFILVASPVFYFNLTSVERDRPGFFTSYYFNLTTDTGHTRVDNTNSQNLVVSTTSSGVFVSPGSTMLVGAPSRTSTSSTRGSGSQTTGTGSPQADGGSNVGSQSSDGLTAGAKAGIGVGVGLGVPILAALLFLIARPYLAKSRARAHVPGTDGRNSNMEYYPEGPKIGASSIERPPAPGRHEAGGREWAPEAEGHYAHAHELPVPR